LEVKKQYSLIEKKGYCLWTNALAIQFPEETLVWCHEDFQQQINLNAISVEAHQKNDAIP
jgi:hypothetical protein